MKHKIRVHNINYWFGSRLRHIPNHLEHTPWIVHQVNGGTLFAASWDEAMDWVEFIRREGWEYAVYCYNRMMEDMCRDKRSA